ncbi:MAG TPA: hypothetical protein VMW63_03105 [Methanoregulaceae archaeon]|nr:hypothetical protein [Methanoregulaceae archaeon]
MPRYFKSLMRHTGIVIRPAQISAGLIEPHQEAPPLLEQSEEITVTNPQVSSFENGMQSKRMVIPEGAEFTPSSAESRQPVDNVPATGISHRIVTLPGQDLTISEQELQPRQPVIENRGAITRQEERTNETSPADYSQADNLRDSGIFSQEGRENVGTDRLKEADVPMREQERIPIRPKEALDKFTNHSPEDQGWKYPIGKVTSDEILDPSKEKPADMHSVGKVTPDDSSGESGQEVINHHVFRTVTVPGSPPAPDNVREIPVQETAKTGYPLSDRTEPFFWQSSVSGMEIRQQDEPKQRQPGGTIPGIHLPEKDDQKQVPLKEKGSVTQIPVRIPGQQKDPVPTDQMPGNAGLHLTIGRINVVIEESQEPVPPPVVHVIETSGEAEPVSRLGRYYLRRG